MSVRVSVRLRYLGKLFRTAKTRQHLQWIATVTENQQRIASGSFHDNVLVITIREDEIGEPETSHALRDEILSLVDGQKLSGIVIDLRHVTFMGSVGFLAFLAVRRRLEVGQIVLCNISRHVRDMLALCRLISNDPSVKADFEAEDTLEAALARFSGN